MDNNGFVLAIDQGTTGSTALLFDRALNIKGRCTIDFPQHFPHPSWVEHDLGEIWISVQKAILGCLNEARVDPRRIAAIGIANQRETTCLWERGTVSPVARAIVWQDRRTADVCQKLKKRGLEPLIRRKTGLCLDPYFSATKLAWLLDNVTGLRARAKAGQLCFGTIDSFILAKMSGGEHRTDVTNASRTLLMDIKKCVWDLELLKIFRIPSELLPEICDSSADYGKTKGVEGLPDGIPITGLVGDQQAALFGQACFKPGMMKCTYGTGAFIVANIGTKPVLSRHALLTTVAWKYGDEVTYAIEGSSFIAGAAVQWFRDGLGAIKASRDIEPLAMEVVDSDGVVFVPALSGLGAPHWLPHATGMFTGITRRTTKAHMARAVLEGIAYQISELVEAMDRDFGKKLRPLRVDGGASANNLLMQFQADVCGTYVVRSAIMETTALGAGLQAGLGIGLWKSRKEIADLWKEAESFQPQIGAKDRAKLRARWSKTIEAVSKISS